MAETQRWSESKETRCKDLIHVGKEAWCAFSLRTMQWRCHRSRKQVPWSLHRRVMLEVARLQVLRGCHPAEWEDAKPKE